MALRIDMSRPDDSAAATAGRSDPAPQAAPSGAPEARRPVIVAIDDQDDNLQLVREALAGTDYALHTYASPLQALSKMEVHGADVVFTGLQMRELDGFRVMQRVQERWPDCKVVIITGYGRVEDAVRAIKNGATDFLTKPLNRTAIPEMLERILALQGGAEALSAAGPFTLWGGQKLRPIIEVVNRVAATNCTIMVRGETGVGKEVLADYVVAHSPRNGMPYIKVNCSALTETIIESELFGHESGAFTGAIRRHIGRFERAHGGTLFLDEIGDLPAAMQGKLLRVLQTHEIERVGASVPIKVDFRLLCATHRNLEHLVKEGKFREDLYYRINTVPIHIPPLRERQDEIPDLALAFLRRTRASLRHGPEGIDAQALLLLQSYSWPGNVRELENCLERACLVARDSVLHVSDIWWLNMPEGVTPDGFAVAGAASVGRVGNPPDRRLTQRTPLESAECTALKAVLEEHKWNFTRAAAALSMSRATLYVKAGKYGLAREGAEDEA